MENKINIAELLKDCPSGMELDCTSYDNVSFDKISVDKKATYPIFCYITDKEGNRSSISFTENGCESKRYGAKCVIFPKGKTTWEGFHRPFKDGDIVISDMGDIHLLRTEDSSYCAYRERWERLPKFDSTITTCIKVIRLATEEEKQKLFDAIKANGYKWNAETKTLEKLPKFNVGDRIKDKNNKIWFVVQVSDKHFSISLIPNAEGYFVPIEDYDEYELAPNKFDINTLIPFESRVLVRGADADLWKPAIYGFTDSDGYYVVGGVYWKQCIPYEANKELLGTTNNLE